ncbi:MAG: AsmA-like C-terminal region-containing protein [Candidatus Omnitrophica bacterium]|nr:AsmA-like C-terminal region-containing protein [Candidatus Omnitrophota bacterium]
MYIICPMRRKNIPLSLLIILACLTVLVFSLLNIFLCTMGKPILQEKLTVILKRKVEIGALSCSTFKGIAIKDLMIWNVTNEHPLYHFKELKIRPSIKALIFEKNLRFRSELSPTKNFKAKIDATGTYNFRTSDLLIKYRLRDVPYIEDFRTLYGTIRLHKKLHLKKGEASTDLLDITITSPNVLLVAKSSIVNNRGKTEIRGKIIAPFIKTDKYQFIGINSEVALVGDKLYFYHLTAELYKGAFQMDSYIDLDNPMPPFSVNANINNMDVYEFSTKSSLVKKEVSGACNANIKLKGAIGVTNALYGKSWVEIKNANLWESTLFKGIGTALFIPNLKEMVFTDAFGALQIKNSRFYTDNFKLVSKEMELAIKGNLGFDDTVDATIKIRLRKELIQESAWLSKISSILLESAGWFIGNIKVTGTTRDPVFTVTPVGIGNILNKVKKTIEKAIDGLR